MKKPAPFLLLATLLAGCAALPVGEVPIEEAQRRLPKEPPVVVADGCAYNRNLVYLNAFLTAESRDLGQQGAKEVIEGLKAFGVNSKQLTVPIMCATEMPPREDAKGGLIADNIDSVKTAKSLYFPLPLNDTVAKDEPLFHAYEQLFGNCDDKAYRKQKRYDCPLLKPVQAALLKARLKTSYVLALSVGGQKLSTANRTAGAVFGLLLGAINIGADEGTARIRLVNLDTGNLVYSSFPADFSGDTPADSLGSGRAGDLRIDEKWVKRMLKPLFEKQR